MRKITFDIETQNTFRMVNSQDPRDLRISLVAIHDSKTDSYTSYLEDELPQLWPIMEQADMLITYNGDHFDIPLLDKYYPGDLTSIKSLDLLVEIKNSCGRRLKLDGVAGGTLGNEKSGHGLQAILWWQQGEIEKIRQYCLDDTKLTKDIYDHALEHGKLRYKLNNEEFDITLDTSEWENSGADHSMTHTLGF